MGDFLFDEMKKLYPDLPDDQVVANIESTDQGSQLPASSDVPPTPLNSGPATNIQGPDTPITAANVPPAPNYRDMAVENVRQKLLGDKYSDAERQKIVDANKADASGPNIAAALAAFGTGLSGGDAALAGHNFLKSQAAKRTEAIDQFDTSKAAAVKDRNDIQSQEKMKREMDPNSIESKLAQDLAVSMGMNPEQAKTLTAAKFKDFSPIMEKKYQVAETTQARKDAADALAESRLQIAHENSLNRADANAKRSEDKQSENDNKDAMKLQQDLDKGWATRGGQGGVIQGKVTAAQAAQALIDQGKVQSGGLDSRQVEELAQSTARLLGGTNAASARVEGLVPHTIWGRAQTLKEWLTNKPAGQDMQAFTDRLAETVKREKELAENQMKEYQIQTLPAHSRLKKSNPDLYNSILQAKGIEPEMIDEKGRYNKRPSLSLGGAASSPDQMQTKMVGGVKYRKVPGGWQEAE